MSNKIAILVIAVSALIGGIVGVTVSGNAQSWSEPTEETYRYLNLFGTVMDRIRKSHVEEKTDKELIEAAIRGMMKSLDAHSSYVDSKQVRGMREQTTGSFFGIGATVSYEKDKFGGAIKVLPMDGSPAKAAGLKNGDLIVEIDGTKVRTLDLTQGVDLIKGPKDTDVTFKVVREGVEKPFDITVTRDKIKIQVVRSRIIEKNVTEKSSEKIVDGKVILNITKTFPVKVMYIRLSSFNENSTKDIKKAIQTMAPRCLSLDCKGLRGFKGLILDLRSNPGGLLDQSVKVTDLFVDEGVVVYTKLRDGRVGSRYVATTGQAIPSNMPIVVLINQFSASASEIVAGALKDLRRATIVGVKSFGKGSVQTIIPLENGGALRLTTAKYYTASGVTIHKVGITPDVVVELKKHPTDEKKNERMKNGVNDTQILKAVEILLSK